MADENLVVKAHTTRVVFTSLTFNCNWSVRKVLEAATWRPNSVFAAFYLKDIQYIWENCRTLGPFVSAGQVINTRDPS